MASSYTANNGIEKPGVGEQEGAWGGTLNTNFDIIDRVLSGVGSISLSGTTHTLTTTDGTLTDGMYRVLLFTGALGANNTVTISPNDQDKLYFVVNNTTDSGSSGPYSVIIKQGTGATVTVANGAFNIVYADGAGSGAAVVSLLSKDLVFGDDVSLQSDGAVLNFGADDDTKLTHTDGTGLTLNSTNKLTFGDTASFVQQSSDGVLKIDGEATIDMNASTAVTVSNDLKLDSDAAVLGFGTDNDVTLTHVADTGLLLNSTMQLQFNDASQNITAPDATTLDINATDEVEINATLADVNANLDVSGTYTGGGTMTTGGNIVIPDAGNIGSASDTDAIAISSGGAVTFSQTPVFPDGSIAIADLDINGGTDVGEALVDADLFIVDNGAGGTNRKSALSRLKTYVTGDNTLITYKYTATAGQTTFTGSDGTNTLAYTTGNLFVTLNGLTLENGTDYTATNGTSVVLTDAATVSDELNIYAFGAFNAANVTAANGDFSVGDDLTLDSDGAVIKLGDDQDVTITHNADEGITLNSKDISGVSSINTGQIGGNRNYIYNGDTSLCQRATSVSNIGNGDGGYHVQDRWRIYEAGTTGGELQMSRATEVPNGFQYSMKLACTTTETLAADESWRLEQRLEGQDLYAWKKGTADALPVTLSFWVNATKTGTNIVSLFDADNSRHISKSYTVSSSNTWEYKTVTFAGDTTGVFDRDANVSLQILFYLAGGSNFTSGTLATSWAAYNAANASVGQVNNLDSTSNNFHITGLQLELGETASVFQNETYGENFIRCARYFEKRVGGILYSANNAGGSGYYDYSHWEFKVRKRAVPTCTGHTGTQQQINEDSAGVYNNGTYAQWSGSSTANSEL